jgi:hypothetical protein
LFVLLIGRKLLRRERKLVQSDFDRFVEMKRKRSRIYINPNKNAGDKKKEVTEKKDGKKKTDKPAKVKAPKAANVKAPKAAKNK